jgi:uncharacterized membrane protein YbhN (UPF0104 family)
MKLPSWLGHVLRFGFAAIVIIVLVRSGALNPALLGEAIAQRPLLCLAAFLIYLVPLQALACGRWWWLLRAAKVPITLRETARLHLTGLFFGGFLPGGTGGDLAKGWYLLKGRGRKEAANALGTVVADRVTGLLGLVLLAACANLLNMRAWGASPILAAQATFILAVAGGLVLLTVAYLSPWKPRWLPSPARATVDGVPEGESRGFLAEFAARPAPLPAPAFGPTTAMSARRPLSRPTALSLTAGTMPTANG